MSCNHRTKLKKDRYFIKAEKYNNCVICLVNKVGALTQEEVGDYMGLTKMRISQVEKKAKEKFDKRMRKICPA
jgi:transcriptional regulator